MKKSTLAFGVALALFVPMTVYAEDFSKLDTNGDGKISLEEGMAVHPEWNALAFKALDKDGNGFLDKTELQSVVATNTAPNTQVASPSYKNGPASYLDAAGPNDILASKLIGMRVYAVDTDVDVTKNYPADSRKNWSDVGEINDVVLDWDGSIKAVVLGVGGFLGIGEKDVAVEMSSLRKVRETADSSDWFLVVNSSKQALTSAPKYVRSAKS
jgi:hypothetical protein